MYLFLVMMNCSNKQTIYFIEMYRDQSLLWDATDSQYKNRNKRDDGLMEIAFSSGIEKLHIYISSSIHQAINLS